MEVITEDGENTVIKLDIKFPNGFIQKCTVADTLRVVTLKKLICEKLGFAVESQTLRFKPEEIGDGTVLDNKSRFIDHGFRDFVELKLEIEGFPIEEQQLKRKSSTNEASTDKAPIKKQKTESQESKGAIDESRDSTPMTEDERLLSLLGASVDIDRDALADPVPGFPVPSETTNQKTAKRAGFKLEYGPAIKPDTTDKPVKTEVANPQPTNPQPTNPGTTPVVTIPRPIRPSMNDFFISETANELADASTFLALATNTFCKAFTRKLTATNSIDLATRQISAATHARHVAIRELKEAMKDLYPATAEMKDALETVDEPVQGLKKLLDRVQEENDWEL